MTELRDMTQEQLSDLPEHQNYTTQLIQPGDEIPDGMRIGDTIRIMEPHKFLIGPSHPDDPMFWCDVDGAWYPVMTENGWAKKRFIL